MKNREAIDILKDIRTAFIGNTRKAIDTVIAALEKQEKIDKDRWVNGYISRQAAIESSLAFLVEYLGGVFDEGLQEKLKTKINTISAADVVPYSIKPDGTLTVTVPKGTKRIGRILVEEDGTQYGGLFYPDTGGCFLSSMERSEQNG